MNPNSARAITKAASKQTYLTIRYLVDRDRVEDAYRAYAYFRWVDDVLDQYEVPGVTVDAWDASKRMAFLERQRSLLEACLRGEAVREVCGEERMLVDLVKGNEGANGGLRAYLRNMMQVMEFDVWRRGRVVSQVELDEYTRWLAVAVTEAMDYFIGHGTPTPRDETRYLAVTAAHIVHMLRDTHDDVQAGYFNIPGEVLDANGISPSDVDSDAYRAWAKARVRLAREYFAAGESYFARVGSMRRRLAGFAYMARFEWLLGTIEKEGFRLRPQYRERRSAGTGLRMAWLAFSSMVKQRNTKPAMRPKISQRHGEI